MYCLTFTEGIEEVKHFYFHNYISAVALQRELLVIEINKIVLQAGGHPLKFNDESMNVLDNKGDSRMSNFDLQNLLSVMFKISIIEEEDYDKYRISIEINALLV